MDLACRSLCGYLNRSGYVCVGIEGLSKYYRCPSLFTRRTANPTVCSTVISEWVKALCQRPECGLAERLREVLIDTHSVRFGLLVQIRGTYMVTSF